MGSGVEQVRATRVLVVRTHLRKGPEHRHQNRRAVDHCRVDHLSLSALGRFQQRAHHSERKEHSATAEVANHVHGRHRTLTGATEVGQRTGQRDVVDVVTRRVRVHAGLTPTSHTSEHQSRIAGQADVGTNAQTLHDTGPEPLDQCVGRLDQSQQRLHAFGVLQVDGDVATSSLKDVEAGRVGGRSAHRLTALNTNDFGAHVRQHHGREGARSDSGDFDDSVASQRSGHECSPR